MKVLSTVLRVHLFGAALGASIAVAWGAALALSPLVADSDLRLTIGTFCCLLALLAIRGCVRRLGVIDNGESSRKRAVLRVIGWIALVVVGCYVLSRLMSPWEAVRVCRSDAPARTKSAGQPPKLRIAAYNIAHGRGTAASNFDGGNRDTRRARLEAIGRLLSQSDLDVVVLNEVDFSSFWSGNVNQARVLADAAGFPYWVEQRNLDLTLPFLRLRFGNAVLSRHPISRAKLVDYPGLVWWEAVLAGKKKGVVCTVDLPSGSAVRVLAVHLEHRSESVRVAGAEVIERLRRDAGPPLIAAGDFNSTRLGFPHCPTDARGRSALSLLADGGGFDTLPDRKPRPAELTFPSINPRSTIDWILVPRAWRLECCEALPVALSDHRPVVATVEIIPP